MSKSKKKNFVKINGINVNLEKPFVVQIDPSRIFSSRYSLSSVKEENIFIDSLKPIFQTKKFDEIQHIDQAMLRYRSVSSLRDSNLFAPPATCHNGQEQICHLPKKTLFINEFDQFVYDRDQDSQKSINV